MAKLEWKGKMMTEDDVEKAMEVIKAWNEKNGIIQDYPPCNDCENWKIIASDWEKMYEDQKKQLKELKLCLREILATSSMSALGERLEKLLQKESDS